MAYKSTNIIARRGYSGLSGFSDIWDALKGAGKGALDYYGQTQQQAGAAAAQAAQNQQLTAALAQQSNPGLGISPTTLLVVGGVGLALVLALRK